ncbi:MAG: alpha-glucan family phosphorylase, partial [Candidatus Saganbacteria bacterium]|nr:alpha-glucan family phosphorylase [Candidatus Saganbacteria bacterium]
VAEEKLKNQENKSIAYFSMEFGLAPSIYHTFQSKTPIHEMNFIRTHEVFSNQRAMDYFHRIHKNVILDLPIYSGGLGVLAGDALKSAADLNLSLAGIGIMWNKGYFKQSFWFKYGQIPDELSWDPFSYPGLILTNKKFKMRIGKDEMSLRIWKYYVFSQDLKSVIPLVLIDSNCAENAEYQRKITNMLYQSDNIWWKLVQRSILGIGGIKAIDALGYKINLYHLNEGHAALAFLERPQGHFAYTCHTPVAAGHDRFSISDLSNVLNQKEIEILKKYGTDKDHKDIVNFTQLALNTTAHVNAVAKKHQEITRLQFPAYKDRIDNVTNGIHTHTWVSKPFSELFDKYQEKIGNWRENPKNLAKTIELKDDPDFRRDIWLAHQENKKQLVETLKFWNIRERVFTISWARRIAPYKRPSLILQNPNMLINIAREVGPIQIILAGKAHPADSHGFANVNEMLNKIASLEGDKDLIKIIFLENYDTYFAKFLTSSVDAWLNNPLPPFEASGTSGMKAILNGVLQISTLDGWIVEAADKGIGYIFGYVPKEGEIGSEQNLKLKEDSEALYSTLRSTITTYYQTVNHGKNCYSSKWIDMMINCVAASGYFNTHRMIEEYHQKIWENL